VRSFTLAARTSLHACRSSPWQTLAIFRGIVLAVNISMRFATHRLLPLFVLVSLLGCAPDPHLSASGLASVQVGSTVSGFDFAQPTRLSEDALETLPAGTPAGRCVLGPSGVSFALARATAGVPGSVSLESLEVVVHDVGDPEVRVSLSDGLYLPSGTCDVTLVYANRADQVAAFTASCDLDGPSGAAHFDANLEYAACRVQ